MTQAEKEDPLDNGKAANWLGRSALDAVDTETPARSATSRRPIFRLSLNGAFPQMLRSMA